MVYLVVPESEAMISATKILHSEISKDHILQGDKP